MKRLVQGHTTSKWWILSEPIFLWQSAGGLTGTLPSLVWIPACAITETGDSTGGQCSWRWGRAPLWQCVTSSEALRVPHSLPSPCLPFIVGSYGLSEFQKVPQRKGKMDGHCPFNTVPCRNACTTTAKPSATSFLSNKHHQLLAKFLKDQGCGCTAT